jgi:hypothetical protein
MFPNAKIQFIHTTKGQLDDRGNPIPDTETFGEEYRCFLNAIQYETNARAGIRSRVVSQMPFDERFLNAKYEVWLDMRKVNFFKLPSKVKITQDGENIGTFEVLEKYRLDVVKQIKIII